jgi:hypothetical protein
MSLLDTLQPASIIPMGARIVRLEHDKPAKSPAEIMSPALLLAATRERLRAERRKRAVRGK